MPEPIPIRPEAPPAGLDALSEITEAVESGLGLPEVVRAASRALDASLVLIDRSSAVLAVAARSTADERALMSATPPAWTRTSCGWGTPSSAGCGCAGARARRLLRCCAW